MRWAWVIVALAAGCGDDSAGMDGGGRDGGGRDGAQPTDSGGTDGAGTDGASMDAGPSCVPMSPPAEGFHVTPAGTASGDGSMGSPWDLATALAQPAAVVPGSIVWVHEGTYPGVFSAQLSGTEEAPIVVRAYPGERATLDGAGETEAVLGVRGDYTWYWGLEITSSDPENRVTDMTGSAGIERSIGVSITGNATDVRFINLVIHDTAQGLSFWTPAVDSEAYGNIISLNGWDAPDRPHGHAIYAQNLDGEKRIEDNVLFHGFSYGVHAYTEGGSIQGFDFVGNVFFQTGTPTAGPREGGQDFLVGGLQPAARIRVESNYGWSRDRGRTVLRLGYSADNEDVVVRDNYIVGETSFGAPWTSITMDGNTFVGDVGGDVDTAMFPDNEYLTTDPTEDVVVVRANRYEPTRGHVIVYHWSGDGTAEVDPTGVLMPGMRYELRDAQDYYGDPVLEGVWDGSPLSVPMAGHEPAQPIGIPGGIEASELSVPDFNVFILIGLDCT